LGSCYLDSPQVDTLLLELAQELDYKINLFARFGIKTKILKKERFLNVMSDFDVGELNF